MDQKASSTTKFTKDQLSSFKVPLLSSRMLAMFTHTKVCLIRSLLIQKKWEHLSELRYYARKNKNGVLKLLRLDWGSMVEFSMRSTIDFWYRIWISSCTWLSFSRLSLKRLPEKYPTKNMLCFMNDAKGCVLAPNAFRISSSLSILSWILSKARISCRRIHYLSKVANWLEICTVTIRGEASSKSGWKGTS